MPRTSHAFEEEKDNSGCEPSWDEKIDWSKSGSFTLLSSPILSDSDVPPPPPSDSSYSTFSEHISSASPPSSSSSVDNNDDGGIIIVDVATKYITDSSASTLLERYDDDYTYDEDEDEDEDSVETPWNNQHLESCIAVLGNFALRCAFDHWKCHTKETEKQRCLRILQIAKRDNQRIVWHESVLGEIRLRDLGTAFYSWRDITTSSNIRRKVCYLMMLFNRWRILTEESVSKRQKKHAALMHWAERLTRKSFSALKLHAAAQRDERKISFRSPEQYTSRLSFSKSAHKSRIGDRELAFASSRESFRSPSSRFSKNLNRFHFLGSSQKSSRCPSPYFTSRAKFSSAALQHSGMLSSRNNVGLSQPTSHPRSTNQNDLTVPYGHAADDIV